MIAFCRSKGIQRNFSVPYSPQQNGIAERKNRTLVEFARSMLHAANLPFKYWGEALMTANFICNRRYTKVLKNITPYERWTGMKPCVSNLKVFGCKCYAHVP